MKTVTVGFVDEDKHEVARWSNLFEDAGFSIVSYTIESSSNLKDLIETLYASEVTIFIVDYLLNEKGNLGFNGDDVIKEFSVIKPNFPMIILTDNEGNASDPITTIEDPRIVFYKKKALEKNEITERFKTIISKMSDLYQKKIENAEKRIQELIDKREREGLAPEEKNELFNKQYELSNLDQRTKETPDHLVTSLKLDQLSTTIDEAEALLNKLHNNE